MGDIAFIAAFFATSASGSHANYSCSNGAICLKFTAFTIAVFAVVTVVTADIS